MLPRFIFLMGMLPILPSIALLGFLHPIHLSTTEVMYSRESRSLQIISRFFADDLQEALRREGKQPQLDIFDAKTKPIVRALLVRYLQRHMRFRPEKGTYRDYPVTFVGYRDEEMMSIVCYLEIENVAPPTSLVVYNDALMEVHRDQSNLVHVTFEGTVRSARLTLEKTSTLLKP